MAVSLSITVPDILKAIGGMDPNTPTDAVIEGWTQDAETLLAIEIYNVSQRTQDRITGPYTTGALLSSVTGRVGSGHPRLISVWFNSSQQYATWGRYYAPYQEGEPIGLDTYTNGMHHMLYDSQTEDAKEIRDWAVSAGQRAEDNFFGGL